MSAASFAATFIAVTRIWSLSQRVGGSVDTVKKSPGFGVPHPGAWGLTAQAKVLKDPANRARRTFLRQYLGERRRIGSRRRGLLVDRRLWFALRRLLQK